MSNFWQLPAAAHVVRGIADDLVWGTNVVVTFPEHAPDGWFNALKISLRSMNLHPLKSIEANGDAPLLSLATQLNLQAVPGTLRIGNLCDMPEFHGLILYLRTDTVGQWPAWCRFLGEYEDACRRLDLAQRTLFVTALHGELACHAPAPANLLRVHPWQDRIDGLNIRLYAAELMADMSLPPWQRQLAVAILAELAL